MDRLSISANAMNAPESMRSCDLCSGLFPGPGIELNGKVYCCNKCADAAQHKLRMLTTMAPKIMTILAIGVIFGYLLRGK